MSGACPRYLGGGCGVTRRVLRLVEAVEKPGEYKIARRGLVLFSRSAARLEGVGVVEARPGLGEEETGNVGLGDPGRDVGVADPLGGAWSAGEDEPGSLSLAMVLAILEGLTWC